MAVAHNKALPLMATVNKTP